MSRSSGRWLSLFALMVIGPSQLRGQCPPQWLPATGGGMNDSVRALAIYNNELIAAGDFISAGGQAANRIACWNGSSWAPLGSGLGTAFSGGSVSALAVYNNELIAGGAFTTAGAQPADNIARWNGSNWAPLGSGTDGAVAALVVFNNELIAGGSFTHAGGSANRIARWNGSSWAHLDMGMNDAVRGLSVQPYGGFDIPHLIAGGYFTTAGGQSANYIAIWNGSAWAPIGAGLDGPVWALARYNNELIAGGLFANPGGGTVNHIARWTGTSWAPIGGGTDHNVFALRVYNDELIAGGLFTHAGVQPTNYIARWDGSAWAPLGTGMDALVLALAVYNNELIAGGDFGTAGGQDSDFWAHWGTACPTVVIAGANPPMDDPFSPGVQPFRDVLQNTTAGLAPQGIGAGGTPALAGIDYANPRVTFSGPISPAPTPGNITVSCTDVTGNGPGDCPSVTSVAPGAAANEYVLTLSGAIAPRECTTLTFLGTAPGQKLQYQSLPGDVNLNGTTSGQDVIALVSAINSGSSADPANLPRYDINRNGMVTGQDVVRLVQLLNGGLTVLPPSGYNAATIAACP